MYDITFASRFKKELKKYVKRTDFPLSEYKIILDALIKRKRIEKKYNNHKLSGNWVGTYELHLKPDILLIYEVDHSAKLIYMLRIGSHSELF